MIVGSYHCSLVYVPTTYDNTVPYIITMFYVVIGPYKCNGLVGVMYNYSSTLPHAVCPLAALSYPLTFSLISQNLNL